MGRNPIKENQNPYFRARKQAAEWDARLESRERASELIGIAAYTLADYELGNVKRVPADKVLIMADLYNAPWLLSNYCKNECPICGFLPLATEEKNICNGNIGFRSALLSYARTGQFKDCRQCERFKGVYFRSDRVEGEKWFYSCVGRAVPVETHKTGDTYGGRK